MIIRLCVIMLCVMIPFTSIEEQLENLPLEGIEITGSGGIVRETDSVAGLALAAVRGEIDLSLGTIFSWLLQALFAEVHTLFYILRHMLIIAILSAFFKAMTANFKNAGIAKLGFYICYIVIVGLLFRTFLIALGIMTDLVSNIVMLLTGSTPVIITLVASGGYVASATAFAPILIFTASFLTIFLEVIMVPLLIFAVAITMANYLSDKEIFDNVSELMHKGIGWALKSIAIIFVAVLGFQRIATPILNSLAIRGTRSAVGAVPAVGSILTGAIDTAIHYSQAVRGAVSSALLLAAGAISIVPILQIVAFIVVYKVTAVLIAPICDERIVDAIDATGNYTALILGVCTLAAFLFIFIVLATLSL
ncbi:MAG: stage III sporulation protein AE [Defluviitaleaceae bacterium]|nr:stage III sporulation protein AE [Defluviitaleaceae bacterium]